MIPQTKVSEFWQLASKGDLYVTKCRSCGRLYFPPRADCSDCMSSRFEWVKLQSSGIILTYTSIDFPPESFKDDAPYIVAVAKLDGGVRMMGWLKGIDYEDAKTGMMVKVQVKLLSDGSYRFEFHPI